MQVKSRLHESFAVVGLCIWQGLRFEGEKPVNVPVPVQWKLLFGFSAIALRFCRRSYLYLVETIRLHYCVRFKLPTHPVAFARLLRSNLPGAWWPCPHGRIRCEQNMNKAKHFLCRASLSSCVWTYPRYFVVWQVWSSETFTFGSWRYLSFCHFNDWKQRLFQVTASLLGRQTDGRTDRCVPHKRRRMSFVSEFVLIQHDRSPCFTLFCCLKFSLVLRYRSNSLRWNCLWVGIPNQNGGFYFSDCLRGNYINPNRNHIGVWNDKWRPWITALLLSYLEMGSGGGGDHFTALQCFSVLWFGLWVASVHL